MTLDPRQQAATDEEQLRLLSIFYMVYGGLAAALSLIALCFVFAGLVLAAGGAAWWSPSEEQAGAAIAGCFFAAAGSAFFVLFGITAGLRILVGFALRRHRYYILCLVAAVLTSLSIPLGALLGVATLVVLMRPSVERLFSGQPPLAQPPDTAAPPVVAAP
ncbi:MAG TPA: hypothetical protein VMW75_13845 [Thermoanaerobaculia bacterium]|nr:hypothetical protein [Thermoanaerobaculia bacterium]